MFIIEKKERLETMARRIRAPAKILFGLRFKNRCIKCGRIIPPGRMICIPCSRRRKVL